MSGHRLILRDKSSTVGSSVVCTRVLKGSVTYGRKILYESVDSVNVRLQGYIRGEITSFVSLYLIYLLSER